MSSLDGVSWIVLGMDILETMGVLMQVKAVSVCTYLVNCNHDNNRDVLAVRFKILVLLLI